MGDIQKVLSSKTLRTEYFKRDFFGFCLFYFTETFTYPSAQFHKDYCKSLENGHSILFNGFRESGKTVLAKYYIIRCICYKVHRYIIFFCDEKSKAQDKILSVAQQLQANKKIINDFGQLFHDPSVLAEKVSSKKRMGDFETTNKVQVEAMGVGEMFRGKVYGVTGEGEFRPSLVVLDDIDTLRSVNTVDLVDKGFNYVRNEIFGGLGDNRQVVFLYNTIKEDGVGPRLLRDLGDVFNVFKVPIIEGNDITWKERYTMDDLAEKRKLSGETAYNQNYLLVPYTGESVIHKNQILYDHCNHKFDKIVIGVDPAISTKEQSDMFAIVATGFMGEKRYVLSCYELKGEEKQIQASVTFLVSQYERYKPAYVVVETVAFQQVLSSLLKRNNMAIQEIKPHKDKVTRLLEHQSIFERGEVFFHPDCQPLIEQLTAFPNSKHDDLVDAFVYSLYTKRKEFVVF